MGSDERQRQAAFEELTKHRDTSPGTELAADVNTAAAVLASLTAARKQGVNSGFLRAVSQLGAIARRWLDDGNEPAYERMVEAIDELSRCVEVNGDPID